MYLVSGFITENSTYYTLLGFSTQSCHRKIVHDLSGFVMENSTVLNVNCLGPVVQNFISLSLSLSPQFVNYISTSKANTVIFFF